MDFIFETRAADAALVESVWYTYSDRDGMFMSQAVSSWEMVVWKYEGQTHLTVRGPETKAIMTESPADAEFFGIQLKMGTFMPQFPLASLVNSELMLPDATGKSFWLNGAVWEMPRYDNADVFINRLIRDGLLVHDPVVAGALQGQEADLSPRALQYRFLRATGLTHNTIRQIERARKAASLLQQGVPILDTVFEAGYFDQPHLTRSLKRFIGQTPLQIAQVNTVSELVPD